MSDNKNNPTELEDTEIEAVQGAGLTLDRRDLTQTTVTLNPQQQVSGAGVSPFRPIDLRETLDADVEDPTGRIGSLPTPHP